MVIPLFAHLIRIGIERETNDVVFSVLQTFDIKSGYVFPFSIMVYLNGILFLINQNLFKLHCRCKDTKPYPIIQQFSEIFLPPSSKLISFVYFIIIFLDKVIIFAV